MLAGKLNWACRVVYGGRTFLRRILDQVHQLNSPNAKFKFNKKFNEDMPWWLSFLTVFNGKRFFLEKMPATDLQAGAFTYAAGAYFHSFVMDKSEIQKYISITRK